MEPFPLLLLRREWNELVCHETSVDGWYNMWMNWMGQMWIFIHQGSHSILFPFHQADTIALSPLDSIGCRVSTNELRAFWWQKWRILSHRVELSFVNRIYYFFNIGLPLKSIPFLSSNLISRFVGFAFNGGTITDLLPSCLIDPVRIVKLGTDFFIRMSCFELRKRTRSIGSPFAMVFLR